LLNVTDTYGKPQVPRDFQRELNLAQSRLELLSQQFRTNRERSQKLKATLQTETRVMNVLDDELRFVQEQHGLQRAKVESLTAEDVRLDSERDQLKSVLDPLLIEVQKLKLLIEGSST
jgi:chromosome segregation ATPase